MSLQNEEASSQIRAERTRGFRKAAAKFATGITVVLVETANGVHGMTANAFMSVSLNPLTIAVSVANHSRMHQMLALPGTRFTVSVLAHHQMALSDAFAGRSDPAALPSPYERVAQGLVIRESAAWFCCTRSDAFVSGDHTIIIGQVDDFEAFDRDPLIFYQGHYYLGFDFSVPDAHWKRLTEA
jgi:flavin reductase (DIM6/NTAB) family NADH-FMN oxidoreductase RutF